MLTKELIANIAQKTKLSKKRCEELLNATTAAMADEIRQGNSLILPGLGTLELKNTAERQVVLPHSGEHRVVPAGVKMVFKPTDALKNEING